MKNFLNQTWVKVISWIMIIIGVIVQLLDGVSVVEINEVVEMIFWNCSGYRFVDYCNWQTPSEKSYNKQVKNILKIYFPFKFIPLHPPKLERVFYFNL